MSRAVPHVNKYEFHKLEADKIAGVLSVAVSDGVLHKVQVQNFIEMINDLTNSSNCYDRKTLSGLADITHCLTN